MIVDRLIISSWMAEHSNNKTTRSLKIAKKDEDAEILNLPIACRFV